MATTDIQQIRGTEKLFCRFAYKGTAGATGNLRLVVQWNQADNTTPHIHLEGLVKNGTWQQAAAQLQAPAGVESFRLYFELSNTGTLGNYWVDAIEVRRTVGTSIIEDAAIKNAQIDNLAVNTREDRRPGGREDHRRHDDRGCVDRWPAHDRHRRRPRRSILNRHPAYNSASVVKAHMDPATGQLRIYSTGDVTHTSTAHGLQIGQSNNQNLVIDENEIMSRFNGTYGELNLNREGGTVYIGGKVGGFNPDDSDAGQLPHNDNHRIYLRGSTHAWRGATWRLRRRMCHRCWSASAAADHLWLGDHAIGATGTGGDAPAPCTSCRGASDGAYHNVSISMASEELNIERLGTDNAGMRSGAGADAAIQWYSGAVRIRTNGFLAYQAIVASSVHRQLEQTIQKEHHRLRRPRHHQTCPVAAVEIQAGTGRAAGPLACSGRWLKTCQTIWCCQPRTRHPSPKIKTPETELTVDVGALAGVAWEGVRQLMANGWRR